MRFYAPFCARLFTPFALMVDGKRRAGLGSAPRHVAAKGNGDVEMGGIGLEQGFGALELWIEWFCKESLQPGANENFQGAQRKR